MLTTLQKYEQMSFPELTVGVSASPVRTSALPESKPDLQAESVQVCFSQLRDLLETSKKKINPLSYLLRTLKTYLALTEGLTSPKFSLSWTKSGMMRSGKFSTVKISECRKTGSGCSLSDILEDDADEKYFLSSEKTAEGDAGVFTALQVPNPKSISRTLRSSGRRSADAKHTFDIVYDGKRLRFYTPRECFRLQGFPDEYFDRAREVNSDNQLYKQAGNSVTVNVIYEIAKKL